MECIVCKVNTNKYKCPKCLERYCSVDCCKIHKEAGCNLRKNPEETEDHINKIEEDKPPKWLIPFKTEDTVDPQKLEQLRHSKELKNILANRHLRQYLKEIDESPNAWKAMKVAMQEPLFIEFADECLKLVEATNQ